MLPKMIHLVALLFLGTVLCSTQSAHAGTKPRPKPVHHHTVIETVSADSITINEGGAPKTFKIGKNTEIQFKGQAAKITDLQPGMRVSVSPDSVDPDTAGSINASDAPKPEASPQKK